MKTKNLLKSKTLMTTPTQINSCGTVALHQSVKNKLCVGLKNIHIAQRGLH